MHASLPSQGGYLLIATSIVLLAVAGLVSSMAFQARNDARYQDYYRIGVRMAQMAMPAHMAVQTKFYTTPALPIGQNGIDQDVFNKDDMPGFFDAGGTALPLQAGAISFTPQAVGVINPLRETVTGDQPSSAIVVLRPFGTPLAADITAIIDGATSQNMPIGVVGSAENTGTLCNTNEPTIVRWGTDPNDCLGTTEAAALNLQDGDLVAPAWVPVIKRLDTRAMMRYPQPSLPDATKMETDLNMDFLDVNAQLINTRQSGGNITISGQTVVGGLLTVTNDTSFTQAITTPSVTVGAGGLTTITANFASLGVTNTVTTPTMTTNDLATAAVDTAQGMKINGTISGSNFVFGNCNGAGCPQ